MVLLFIFLLGLSVGSFLNVLIDRLPKEKSITGRSYCDHCKKQLKSYDLVPVLSFAFLKGRCRYCGKKLSFYYPLVESLTGIIFVVTFLYAPADEVSLKILYLGIFSSLVVIFFSDLNYQIIPNQIQVSFFAFALLILIFQGAPVNDFPLRVFEGLLLSIPLALIYYFTKGRGMGFADVKFSFLIGFFLRLQAGFLALYLAFIIGSIVGIFLILFKQKKLKSKIAFGPFLAVGTAISIFCSQQILAMVSRFFY